MNGGLVMSALIGVCEDRSGSCLPARTGIGIRRERGPIVPRPGAPCASELRLMTDGALRYLPVLRDVFEHAQAGVLGAPGSASGGVNVKPGWPRYRCAAPTKGA